MKLLFVESHLPLSLLDVKVNEFFETLDGFICQMLSNNKYQTLLHPNRITPAHEIIPFSRNEKDEILRIKRKDTLPNLLKSKTITFGAVPVESFFQLSDNSVWQKSTNDTATRLTDENGNLCNIEDNYTEKFHDGYDAIKKIFPNDATAKVIFQ
jgi:hypothetical protein